MDALDRRVWKEVLWPRMIKTVVLSGACLFWKEVGETPTNPSAIYRWQTDALIRHDSFATGLKSKYSKTSCRVLLKKKPESYIILGNLSFLAYLLQEPVHGVMGTLGALLALHGG